MRALQFSDAQKAFILRQGAEGVPVAEICRKAGIRSCDARRGVSVVQIFCRRRCAPRRS